MAIVIIIPNIFMVIIAGKIVINPIQRAVNITEISTSVTILNTK